MKIKIAQRQIELIDILAGSIFFSLAAYVFHLYAFDYSPLWIGFIIAIYVKFSKKAENLPPCLDLYLLGALAILVSFLTNTFFKDGGIGVTTISFALLVTALFGNLELSLLFSLFTVSLEMSLAQSNLSTGISLFSAAFIVAKLSLNARRRFQIIKSGLAAGAVLFVADFILERGGLYLSHFDLSFLKTCLFNGMVSTIAVLGTLPIFEFIFKIVTNVSLLELSDFNHPLLKRLILEAPGTYHHSLVVANLSEAAAEAVCANPVLARVGAYYHDIGKMLKPNYFVENLVGFKDIHKDLKPSISRIIITNHVKEGAELARKYHLNQRIVDFILQHHGRTLVYFFYQKAKELEPEKEHEEDYRYPGPKPQTKEAVIVSLADTVEALSRTLDEPTPSRIEEMVRSVVKKRFMEGELDESDLTLKDLEHITQSFIRMLNALFHTRINYPKENDRNNKSAKDKEG